jgi:hypothetical protein
VVGLTCTFAAIRRRAVAAPGFETDHAVVDCEHDVAADGGEVQEARVGQSGAQVAQRHRARRRAVAHP